MTRINNNLDYRIWYSMMLMLEERLNPALPPHPEKERLQQRLIELKRELRRYSHRTDNAQRRIIKDYGDGFISLERIPFAFGSIEEAREYFQDYRVMEVRPSPYDCTGQLFTHWFKVVQRRGAYWVYHSVGLDV